MKQFIKYTLATITGIVIMSVIFSILAFGTLAAIVASSGDDVVVVEDNSVLSIKLNGQIAEHSTEEPLNELLGTAVPQLGLDDICTAIDKAAKTPEIKGIYIEAGIIDADYASVQEIRNALLRFKASKKWIVSYADEYTQGAYYICSVADKVMINPEGMLDIHGIAAQPMYLRDLLAKFGVKMTVVKVGAYKSATEQYTEDHMSDANRQQVTRYISALWNNVTKDISKSRGISVETLNQYADSVTLLRNTDYLLKHKLVDKCVYADNVKDEIKALLKIDKDDAIEYIGCRQLARYITPDDNSESSDNTIALYYAEGSISQFAEAGALSKEASIVSKKMVRDLDKLAKDDDVKAVVIRVNSGGGDAFASEEIWHSVVELKKKKPVVISMSGAAASGAYYLSAGASWIVAQPMTITGSIGIFGAFPDLSGLMQDKLGIKYDHVKTNAHSDFTLLQTSRPFNAEEQAMLQQYINRGYELFCKRVSDGRKIPLNRVKEIAQGRVWIGTDALSIKLIDQLGGMPEALKKAAELAKIKDYKTVTYPESKSMMEQLLETAEGHNNNLDEQLRSTLGMMYEPFVMVRSLEHQSPVQARLMDYIKF